MHHYQLAIPQLMSNGMRVFLGLIVLADEAGVKLSVIDILAIYYPQENSKDHDWKGTKEANSEGSSIRREARTISSTTKMRVGRDKPLRRLFGTLLFIEPLIDEEALIAELALDTMNIDFPNPKDLLVKKKAQKEAAKAAASEKATQASQAAKPPLLPIIESSPEPPTKPIQSPAKKRKADKKPKRKVPAKRKKIAKTSTSETDVERHDSIKEDKGIEVDLPQGISLFQNKSIGAGIMRQLLSDVDVKAINVGRIQNHLDELLWDGLKSNLRAMGLIYRASNKVVEQKKLVRELQEIDRERGEKLLDIKRKFADVKSSADDNQSVKEGANMMQALAERYDEATAKIKTLEESLK
ncbi:hypothetical protein TIFTF001_028422 [Ficus carica]|uniref:Uncharacterized protein n=1 Tax=Ficus carica TaxID=3494 RepID=A0AA88DQD9_FICCA|nr:hypothetical protein TIFTF001_028422 [Ficus carica]